MCRQMHPTRQQQPSLAFDQFSRRTTLAEELLTTDFIDGRSGVLHDVELVVHDAALRQPLLDALPKWVPHVHTGRSHSAALKGTQLRLEELVERLLPAFRPEPYRLAAVQVAHHGDELLLLAKKDLVDPHLPKCWFAPRLSPTCQITLIDGPHRARRKAKLPRHSAGRRTLAGLPDRILEALAERCLRGQQGHLLRFHSAVRAAHTVQLHHHCGQIFKARQIAHFPLIAGYYLCCRLPAARTDQQLIGTPSSHPQLQPLALFINLMPVYLVARPAQYPRPIVVSHRSECSQMQPFQKTPTKPQPLQFPAQSPLSF